MTTPICPDCGSVRARPSTKNRLRCDDCGRDAAKKHFMTGGPETGQRRIPNQHWRDGAALSMDNQ